MSIQGSREQRNAKLILREARRAWKYEGAPKLNENSRDMKLLHALGVEPPIDLVSSNAAPVIGEENSTRAGLELNA